MKLSPIQEKIVETPGNLIVRASAGTGKTHTMVNKIAKEIDDNHTHKVIAAITFTIKAAQEIKDRLSVDVVQHFIGTNNSSKIHGVGAAIGFMALLFFPLLNGIVSVKQKDIIGSVISISSFFLALAFFICFIMGDKEQFQNTILKYEGLWERLTLFCMYVPFIYRAIGSILL